MNNINNLEMSKVVNNNDRTNVFKDWAKEVIEKDITSTSSMEELHSNYCAHCESRSIIGYRRKYFAYLLRLHLIEAILNNEVLIYHNKEVLVKGVKVNNQFSPYE